MKPLLFLLATTLTAQTYDVVIAHGRVIYPETKLDAVRNIGIDGGAIKAISTAPLKGRATIDASGLVVAPGFIDLHEHGQDFEAYTFQVRDGVTSSFELEVGTADVDAWYASRAGKAAVNHGVSIGHIPVRMKVLKDPGEFLPSGAAAHQSATEEQISEMKQLMERGFKQGAVSAGFGMVYTPAATRWEILEMFRLAARFHASCHVHLRGASSVGNSEPEEGLEEAIAASAITGAPLHVVHINSSSLTHAPHMLRIIAEARARGLDVTTEMYPYIAGATRIESAVFDALAAQPNADYGHIQWTATGERLNRESFLKYRKQGGNVIIFSNTESMIEAIVRDPLPMIASDGFGFQTGTSHPRSAGTYSRILGLYVRERKLLTLPEAIQKMTLMPAQRLESRVPVMRKKGRIQAGADADITVFDPATVRDQSTYEKGKVASTGIRHVLVNGVFVVKDGALQSVTPGQGIRAPVR